MSESEPTTYDPDDDPELQRIAEHLARFGSVASNPGGIKVQWIQFLRCFPTATPIFLALIAAAGWAGWSVHWGWWIPAVILSLMLAKLALNAKLVMEFGCACPAVVVSHDPDLIAVCTNLSNSGRDYWVIKILPHPLKRMTGGRPPAGTRLATVSGYGPAETDGHWNDFEPVAAACATTDRASLARVMDSFEPDDWAALEAGLSKVPERTPGLYPFTL